MVLDPLYEWLDDLLKSKANAKEIEECLNDIEDAVVRSGLGKHALDKLWRKILLLPRQRLSIQGIHFMIPKDDVLPETLDFLLAWVLAEIRGDLANSRVLKAVLQWLTCAVHCTVVSTKDLQHSYYLLLSSLMTPGYANEICHLLYYLTEPHLVTPYTVKRLLSVKFPKRIYSHIALVSLYKRLKPHLIANESIKCYENDLELFAKLPRKLLDCFNLAKQKRGLHVNRKQCRYPNWRLQLIAYQKPQLGSISYISEMTLAEAVREASQSDIFIGGTVFDTFLMNPYGFVFFGMATRQLHEWMQTYIEKELEANETTLLRMEKPELILLLTNLCKLQNNFGGEPIGAIDRFLKKNLSKWDGVKYTKQMFGLLCYIVVSDYAEVFERILKPLVMLNMKFKDIQYAKYTLRSLGRCIVNNIKNLDRKNRILYSAETLKPNHEALEEFINSFRYLCTLFVNMFAKNSEILHEILDIYIILTSTNDFCTKFPEYVLPLGIIQKILINSDYLLVEKFAQIVISFIQADVDNEQDKEPALLQMGELLNIFFKNILRTRIFEKEDHFKNIDEQISKLPNIRRELRSRNSLTFMPLIRIDDEGKYRIECNQTAYKDTVCKYTEHYASLIKLNDE